MSTKSRFFKILSSILLVASILFANASVVFADDGSGSETSAEPTTEEPAEPPTTDPIESGQEQPLPALLDQVPESTEVVVLDQSGEAVPLATEEALAAILEDDPMWCPAGVLPGDAGCRNFTGSTGITNLLTDMRNNTNAYDENGIIYFTTNPGTGSFSLTNAGASLSTDYATLRNFNLTLQGGWNGVNGAGAAFTSQTNFGSNGMTIGTSSNPWVGNITLNNFTFSGVSGSNGITVYTTSGNILMDNVDVAQQSGGNYTAYLDSQSGNITIQNGSTFDGNNSGANQNRGFSATTDSGTINITGTSSNPVTFTDANGCGTLFGICLLPTISNYNGATLNAPTVNLTNVSASNNDLNGIQINNASNVTLTNVTAINNGTDLILQPNSGDVGAGVFVNGATSVTINGGVFNGNERYGVEAPNGVMTIVSAPACSANDLGCLADSAPPVLNLPANITAEATGASGVVVSFAVSASDTIDGTLTATCTPASGSNFALGTTTVNCSATDSNNHTTNGSFTVTVRDTTPPSLNLPANIVTEATGPSGETIIFSTSASDLVSGPALVTCAPASGSIFTLGVTTVNCTATDTHSNTAHGSFTVTVQDTTSPVINPAPNIYLRIDNPNGETVEYVPPATFDLVDGAGVATCTPSSGSLFPKGITQVTCTAQDSSGNTAQPVTFLVTLKYDPKGSLDGTGGSMMVMGGERIDLDCFTTLNAFGIKVVFHNLCDHQTVIKKVDANNLPGKLPAGLVFLKGLDVSVLFDELALKELPHGSGIELDFPIAEYSQDQYAVLLWDTETSQWLDVTQVMKDEELSRMLSTDSEDELYQIEPTELTKALYRVLSTDKTGLFVIVKK